MKIISHRGNIDGKNPNKENKPTYIQKALNLGFDVEIDVWYVDGKFFLGHDAPMYHVDLFWLSGKSLWCHTKNQQAFEKLLNSNITCFWHETDKMTLTSNGLLWMYYGNYSELGVTVCLDKPGNNIPNMWGVCTDYPNDWNKIT